MMVLCFLMSIPLKMMAETVTIHFVDEEGWGDYAAYVYDTTKPDDGSNLVTGTWHGQKVTNNEDIKTLANGYKVVTWTIDLKTFELSNLVVIFNNNNNKQYPASGGWKVTDGLYYYKNGTTSTTPPSEGGSTGGGSGSEGGSGTTTEKWNTVTENHLTDKPRVYSQGFYLAGNFFTFDTEGINYNDAVFKFQQQKDQSIAQIAETPYDVYMVEIPASLTAQAQVMYVDANGNKKGIFGPGTANKTIDKGTPATGLSTEWANITANESTKLLDNTQNYWNFSTRNESTSEYSD